MSHTRTYRSLSLAAAAAAALTLSACGAGDGGTDEEAGTENEDGIVELTVGASPVPHADILQFVDDELAEEAGLITLSEDVDSESATFNDVDENPQNFEFIEADASALTRTLDDVEAAVINGNNALEAGLSPTEDGLLVEDGEDNPYANFLAVRSADEDNEAIQALNDLLHSEEVREYIEENWQDGEVIPAF